MSLRSIITPGVYHGLNKKPPFFEGWYYKLVSADELYKVAIIPGVILGQDAHAFLQILDGVDGATAYIKFPIQDFRADDRHFAIEINENRFDDSHLHLALNTGVIDWGDSKLVNGPGLGASDGFVAKLEP